MQNSSTDMEIGFTPWSSDELLHFRTCRPTWCRLVESITNRWLPPLRGVRLIHANGAAEIFPFAAQKWLWFELVLRQSTAKFVVSAVEDCRLAASPLQMRMARDGGKIVKFTQQRPTSRILAGGFSDISIRVGFVGRCAGGWRRVDFARRRELMPLKSPLKVATFWPLRPVQVRCFYQV